MADEFVLPKDIGTIDCSDIQPWDRKSLRYDYILKATTGDEDYPIVPEEVGICTNLWVHGNAQIDNIQINQTITGNPISYLGDVTAGDINSTDINVNGTVTADYFVGDGSGLFNIAQSSVFGLAGINTAGTSMFNNLFVSNIVTAGSFVSSGTTAVYAGINISTVDSNTTAFHYVTFDTNNSGVNISNFTSGKKFEIVCRNSSVGAANLIIKTSTTSSGHVAVPRIVFSTGSVTNGTISVASGAGLLISVFNMGGTIVGSY